MNRFFEDSIIIQYHSHEPGEDFLSFTDNTIQMNNTEDLLNELPLQAPGKEMRLPDDSDTDCGAAARKAMSSTLCAFLDKSNEETKRSQLASDDTEAESDNYLDDRSSTELDLFLNGPLEQQPEWTEHWNGADLLHRPKVEPRREADNYIPVFNWRRCRPSITKKQVVESIQEVSEEEEVPAEAPIKFEELKKLRILGEGFFGQVRLVSAHNRPYALKVQSKWELAQERKIDFAIREKQIMAQMDHPFIIHLVAAYQDTHCIYLLMDIVQGGELWSMMHPQTETETTTVFFPESQTKFYALALADALNYIHDKKVAYRDLKPENVLIDRKGYPVLIDFGLAKTLLDGEKTYTMVGTPHYLSPELVNGDGHDMSADNWALGILVYEMLAGCNPFFWEGMDQRSLFFSITEDDYDQPQNVSKEAISLISQLLIKEPENRLGSPGKGVVTEHEWFRDLDLSEMRKRKVQAPWIPNIVDALDTSYFDDWSDLEDKSEQTFPALEPEEAEMFEDFC